MNEFIILAIPFLGTSLGAAMVFFLKKQIAPKFEKFLLGFAAGVITSVVIIVVAAVGAMIGLSGIVVNRDGRKAEYDRVVSGVDRFYVWNRIFTFVRHGYSTSSP